MLSGDPLILAHDPDRFTIDPVSAMALELSEPVVADGARERANYGLLHLGDDGAVGGGNDRTIHVRPQYVNYSTEIELNVDDLGLWSEVDYTLPNGILGNWQVEDEGASVKQTDNGGTSFYVNGFDTMDGPFAGRFAVEQAGGDDDFVGLVFGFQQHAETGLPDSYYLVSWKGAAQGTAEEGLKLAKVTGTGLLAARPDLWDLDASDPHIDVLAEGPSIGWQNRTEYDFEVDYRSDGSMDRRSRKRQPVKPSGKSTMSIRRPWGPVAWASTTTASLRFATRI